MPRKSSTSSNPAAECGPTEIKTGMPSDKLAFPKNEKRNWDRLKKNWELKMT